LRRIIILGTALAVLLAVATAWATTDPNTYAGSSLAFTPKVKGTAKKPVPVGWTEVINAASNQSGFNTAPLTDIKTTIYGIKVNSKAAPTCPISKIAPPNYDKNCPSKSLVASGTVQSALGSPSRTGQTIPCDPDLHVYNGGKNTVVFFFTVPTAGACATATTGSAAPYKGTFSKSGKNLVLNVPLPPDISTNAANLGLYASLQHQNLVWKKITKKIKGKKVGFFSSFACKAGRRPYSTKFTDTTNGTTKYTTNVPGSDKC
jgi:hypothetical protein